EQLADHLLSQLRRPVRSVRLHDPTAESFGVAVVEMLSVAAEGDLVSEVLSRLARAGGAAQHPKQRQVVQVGTVCLAHPGPTPELESQQARSDRVLDRQPDPKISC